MSVSVTHPQPSAAVQRDAVLVMVAFQWWMEQRPAGWTIAQHLANPTAGLARDSDVRLASAVSLWTKGDV
jgi:hypothetical protein